MRTKRKALTSLELTISLVIVSIIALSAAGVTLVLSESHAETESRYANTQAGRGALAVMQKYLNESRLVTAIERGTIVLWHRDRNEDGKINLSELVMLTHDTDRNAIKMVRVAFGQDMESNMVAALDYRIELFKASDLDYVMGCFEQDSRTYEKVIVENVQEFKAVAEPPCPMSKMVRLYLTVGKGHRYSPGNSPGNKPGDGGGNYLAIQSAAALRVDETDRIMTDAAGQYTLGKKDDSYWMHP